MPEVTEDSAATKLQSIARGRTGRRRIRQKRSPPTEEDATRRNASVSIQRIMRGVMGRKRVAFIRSHGAAAIKIQAAYRGRAQRRILLARLKGGRALDMSDVRKGFSNLGRSGFDLFHAFLDLSCAGLGVNDISILSKFPALQTLDLHENCIKDLTPLKFLPQLTTLNLAENLLKEVLDFDVPRCHPENMWNTGDRFQGSQVEVVNLSHNEITSIRDLVGHSCLRCLDLSHNQISQISGLDALSQLRELKLSHNQIQALDGLENLALRHLSVDHNQIETVHLGSAATLLELNLSHNRIASLDGLQKCTVLQVLDVSSNFVAKFKEVEHLADLALLCSLCLQGNPVEISKDYDTFLYRLQVLLRLKRLQELDSYRVTAEEKVKAVNVHGGEGSDLRNRTETHSKHFPTTDFANQLPPHVSHE